MLPKNLTVTTTISTKGVEFVRFTYGGGTKNEHFAAYLEELCL